MFTMQIHSKLIQLFTLDGTFFHYISQAQIKLTSISRSCNANRIVSKETCLEHLILPVSICIPYGIIVRIATLIHALFIIKHFELLCISQANAVCNLFPTHRTINTDLSLTFFRLLSSNDNNTISTTHTKDSQGRRVFQDFHRFNIRCIQIVDVIRKQSVHYIQRSITIDRVCTANTNFRILPGTSCIDNLHTGNLTLNRSQRIGRWF